MGNIIPVDSQVNLLQSIGRYFFNHSFSKDDGVTTKTLRGHYPQGVISGTNSEQLNDLRIGFSFPDVLTDVKIPSIFLQDVEYQEDDILTMGEEITEEKISINIIVLGGGYRTNGELDDGLNKTKSAQLAEDIKTILDFQFIDFFDFSDVSNPVRTDEDIRIEDQVIVTEIAPSGDMEAERYRFDVTFDASLIKAIKDNL